MTRRSVDDAAAGESCTRNGERIGRPDAYVDLIAETERLSEADIITALFRRPTTHKLTGARVHLFHACDLLNGHVLSKRTQIGRGAAGLV